jgi:hypothetical protein
MPISVLNPTSLGEARPLRVAHRLDSLAGRLVGVLDNGKVNSDRILHHVETLLLEQFRVREVLWRRKHDFSRPAPVALLAELSACDAVITGIGD